MRDQGAVDSVVVVIEPFEGIGTEKFRNDRRSIKVTQGKCLEIKPFSKFRRSSLTAEDYVLMPYSMHAFPIQGRFIRSNHARKERLRVILESY